MTSLKALLSYSKIKSSDSKKKGGSPAGLSSAGGASSALVLGLELADSKSRPVKELASQKEFNAAFEEITKVASFSAKHEKVVFLLNHSRGLEGHSGYQHLVGVGIGTPAQNYPQKILSLGGRVARELRAQKISSADIHLDSFYLVASSARAANAPKDFAGRPLRSSIPTREEYLENFAMGVLLGLYTFDRYKSKAKDKKSDSKKGESEDAATTLSLRFLSKHLDERKVKTLLEKVSAIAESVYLVRDLQTTPGCDLTPPILAKKAQEAGKESGFAVDVWDEKKLAKEGMNGILTVGRGSKNPPRLIVMEYNASKKNLPTVVLVGKGITFDSGGYCLKPSNMMEMKWDMSGSAAVIGALSALAKLKAPVHAVGIVASAENMIDGDAARVGDIYTAYDGQTVEVLNTDAEGRLVLGDALAYAASFKPTCVLDAATLTGAVSIALGSAATGMMGNNSKLLEAVARASEQIGERVWELPLYEEYHDDMKSKIADIKNIGSNREAGSSKGGAFLNFFVKDQYPWVHLDVASTADTPSGQGSHCPPDVGTAVPMRAMVEFAANVKKYFG